MIDSTDKTAVEGVGERLVGTRTVGHDIALLTWISARGD